MAEVCQGGLLQKPAAAQEGLSNLQESGRGVKGMAPEFDTDEKL